MNGLIKKAVLCLLCISAFTNLDAQVVKGVVRDVSGSPLAGVVVMLESGGAHTVTDSDGAYSIKLDGNSSDVLNFSMLGMKTASKVVGKNNRIDVMLEEDVTYLEEIVVVGYQEVKRKDFLGSVSSINSEKLIERPVNTVSEALAGRLAGVTVTAPEGSPDATMDIKIRGVGSITQSSAPLYIVDGFPVDDLNSISSAQIKSMDVLKDAFASAIYGSKGANGVVVVTTKSGAPTEKITVGLNAYFGAKKMANAGAYRMMGSGDFVRAQYELAKLKGAEAVHGFESEFGLFTDIDLYDDLPVNDHLDRLFGNIGTNYNVDLSIAGRNKQSNWVLTLARIGEKGIMTGSSFGRTNIGFRSNIRMGKKTSLDINVRFSDSSTRGGSANNFDDTGNSAENGRINQAICYSPLPIHKIRSDEDDDDTYFRYRIDPSLSIADNDLLRKRVNLNLNGAFNWTIWDELRFKSDFGYGVNSSNTDNFIGATTYWVHNISNYNGHPANRHINFNSTKFRNSNTLRYDFKNVMNPNAHALNIIIGQELTYARSNNLNIITEGFPEFYKAEDAWNFMSSGQPFSNDLSYSQNEVMLSFFGRASYTLFGRYSIGATIRGDGSSKFAEGNRWGWFPSAAVSWDIKKEPWMMDVKWVNGLKLRYSLGSAGNNNIPAGQTSTIYHSAASQEQFHASSVWLPSDVMPNSNLTWETTYTHNIGLDFDLLGGTVNGSLEFYQNTTDDLLVKFPVTGVGYKTQYRNMGQVRNRGVELTLNLPVIRKKNFDLSLQGNIAYNRNEVLNIGALPEITTSSGWASTNFTYDYKVTPGRPLGDVYGYQMDGIYQVSDFEYQNGRWELKEGVVDATSLYGSTYMKPGAAKLKDQNGDGKIDDSDLVVVGNTLPDVTGGFSLNAFVYGFDISANFSFMAGNDVYNANKISFSNARTWKNVNLLASTGLEKRWTCIDWNTGEIFKDAESYEAANAGATMWTPFMDRAYVSDWAVEDGSFLRMQSVTIGYTFPKKWTGKIAMEKLRLYVTGTNLFCLTRYSGFDPEVDCRRATPLTPGCDFSAYPKSIGIVGGINVTF